MQVTLCAMVTNRRAEKDRSRLSAARFIFRAAIPS
jgi:hypothetical protein